MLRALRAMLGLWLIPICSLAAANSPPPPSAFARAPAMESLALSPNGFMIAWVANGGTQPVVQVLDLANSRQLKPVRIPDGVAVRGLDWADDQVLLMHSHVEQTSADDSLFYNPYRTLAVEVATGKSRVLSHTGIDGLLALRTNKPQTVIAASRGSAAGVSYAEEPTCKTVSPRIGSDDDRWGSHLYEIDTSTGTARLIRWGTKSTEQWVVGADGQPVARSDFKSRWKLYTIQHCRGSDWVEIFRLESGETPELLGLTHDRTALLMRARLKRQTLALWRLSLSDSTLQLVMNDDAGDLAKLVRDPYSGDVLGAWTNGLTPAIRWIDEQAEKRAASLTKTFGGKQVEVSGRSADGGRALVGVSAHAAPVTYYLVDFKRGTADIVGEQYPELVDVTLGEVRALTFKARDGYEIPAYLTLPPGRQVSKLPLVVLPHDGPEARNETKFDPVAQFLASRGYAVLQPQIRGSIGFGETHRKAGYRQWGGLMQNDVTDGVQTMIEQGIADSARVCIAGTGYGGYVALAGVAFTPELYACAISINGIADLPNMLGHVRRQFRLDDAFVGYFEELLGSNKDIAEKSPARAASQVKAPVLLIHGVDADLAPVEQSRQMMKALGGHAPHELIELPGNAYWESDRASRGRVLAEMERFLAKHLPASE